MFCEQVKQLCRNAPKTYCAPLLMRDIDGVHRAIFGGGIDYSAEKLAFNSAVLKMEEELFSSAMASPDPVAAALSLAAAANYIDFARLSDLNEDSLSYVMQAASRARADGRTLALFKRRLGRARTLLYIHDNCGEIVFDKIFIRVMGRLYPQIAFTSLVRGGPIINDVTAEDAAYVGLNLYSRVVGSGVAIPGTYLKEVSEETLALLKNSDMIISKGLGNLETLYGEGYDIFHVFMCKCGHIAARFGCDRWAPAFVHEGSR